jgi:hypothetical protein
MKFNFKHERGTLETIVSKTKTMKLSQKVSRSFAAGRSKVILLLSGVVLVGGSLIPSATHMVGADSISAQISQLQAQNADAQNSLNGSNRLRTTRTRLHTRKLSWPTT